MSKPSVEEIVAEFEKYGDLDQMRTTEVRSLIADWRKRGEALERIADEDRGMWAGYMARSALTQPRSAESKPISPHQEK